jgi:ELWxxDGT repeat protein
LSLSDEFGSELFALDDRILFTGADEPGENLEPWVSDGTVAGTRRLQEIAPGGASSFPTSYTRVGSRVFFVANDTVHGNELWVLPLLR